MKLGQKLGASVFVLGLLGACSSVPDAVNPVEWYRSTVDMVTSDDDTEADETQTADAESVPGEDTAFPDINSVPDKPGVLSADESGQGLIADPNKPEYASSIARQTEDGISDPQPSTQADLQPAPPAQPVAPVIAAETTIPQSTTPPAEPDIMAQLSEEPEPATTVASNPLVIQEGLMPSGETYDEYRARLMSGLEQSGTSAFPAFTPTASTGAMPIPAANIDMYGDTV
ncbi:MAG: hypothetical protein HON65_15235, partial [Rhodospirillales bacterium]|nr:hypothetical protein [Rhodospirillales bacterium]